MLFWHLGKVRANGLNGFPHTFMKVTYDPDKDILQISFSARSIEETTQITPGMILDYDEDGRVVGLELRRASERIDNPYEINYSVGAADNSKPSAKVNNVYKLEP